jgi:hypothetical protein
VKKIFSKQTVNHTGDFVHQTFATKFEPMYLFPVRIFPENKLFNTNTRINDDLKEATQQEVFSISTETLEAVIRMLSPDYYTSTVSC